MINSSIVNLNLSLKIMQICLPRSLTELIFINKSILIKIDVRLNGHNNDHDDDGGRGVA